MSLIAIKDLMLARNAEHDAVFVQHYVASEAVIDDVAGGSLRVEQQTEYPWKGEVSIRLHPAKAATFALHLRIPNRGESRLYTLQPDLTGKFTVQVNGEPQEAELVRGYACLRRTWAPGDRVDLSLPMEIQRVHADQRVEADRGRVALQRGPLVYNIEDADNRGQSRSVVLPPDLPLRAVWKPDLLGGVMAIESDDHRLLAIPNYARLNREGWSQVWIAEKPEVADPPVEPTIASQSKVTTSYQTDEGRFSTRAIQDQKQPEAIRRARHAAVSLVAALGNPRMGPVRLRRAGQDRRRGSLLVRRPHFRGPLPSARVLAVLYRDGDQWKPVQNARPTPSNATSSTA